MANQTDTIDVLTDAQKATMIDHFGDYEAEYRTEPRHHEVVHENDDVIVVADHTGQELNEWAKEFGLTREQLSTTWHKQAQHVCNYSWSTSDPIVFEKAD